MVVEPASRPVAHGRERALAARREPRVPRRERRLIAAAFHEAGHAVAAYHLHLRLRRMSIGAGGGEALGWLDLWLPRVTSGDTANVRLAQSVERDIIVLLAGAQAERMSIGRSGCPAGGLDFYEAMRRAGSICRTSEEMSAYLRWLQLRTRALVKSPTWRQPIETLATCLLERRQLGAWDTRAIIRAAISRVQRPSSTRDSSSARGISRRHAGTRDSRDVSKTQIPYESRSRRS
jgi:hypothetical protein